MKFITNMWLVIISLILFSKVMKSDIGQQLQKQLVSNIKHVVSNSEQTETKQKQLVSVEIKELLPYAAKYQGKDTETFFDSLFAMSKRLQIQPLWVLKLMQNESGLNPRAKNSIGAAGLIQFLPQTAAHLGTNTAFLLRSSGTQQLFYIEKFWKPVAHKINSYEDLRLYNLFPAALGQPDNFILESSSLSAHDVAIRNPIFDTNGDMKITVHEFKKVVSHE